MRSLDLSLYDVCNKGELAELDGYSIKEDNEKCIQIFSYLVEAFYECERYAPKYLNLVAIFFPDLMRISTGCVLKQREIEKSHIRNEEKDAYPSLLDYPFCGYRELLEGTLNVYAKRGFPGLSSTHKIKFLNTIGNIWKRCVCYCGFWPIHNTWSIQNLKYIFKHLQSINIFPLVPAHAQVYIPRYENQHAIVQHFFEKITTQFKIPIQSDEFITLFDLFYSPFIAEREERVPYQVLVTGTLQKRETRILAAQARSQDIPVITISHGEGDQLIVDEPRIGYGEFSYSSFFVGYGKKGVELLKDAEYAKGLYEPPTFIPANSNICKKIYNAGSRIQRLSDISHPTYMYVPATFIGYKRYGPFHHLPDVIYFKWQKIIRQLFPDVIYKRHPKLVQVDVGFTHLETTPFEVCFQKADVYIFDVIATAFNIAVATDKPIIYFDIGIRNIVPSVVPFLKERCIWVDARDNKSIDYLRSEIERHRNKVLINNYTEQYCIIDSNEKREDTILSAIKNILK